MKTRILVVDDDPAIGRTFRLQLSSEDRHVDSVLSAEEAFESIAAERPDLVITDLRMPGLDGLEFINKVKESHPSLEFVVITAHEDMDSAIEAMKVGALEYLVKPLDLDEVERTVERCLSDRSRRRSSGRSGDPGRDPAGHIVGRDPKMIEAFKLIGRLARNRETVLIRGETGTGKELVARAIHTHSDAAEEPFLAVNCTAIQESLLESELFGHVRGAFTGAVRDRRGFFELAGRGTIFLDEIGDTSPDFQAKLLRVLETKLFHPVGAESARRTDARVLAATHRPIEELVREGSFREDLYFRLRVVELRLPALRERRGDIPLLTAHLLERIGSRLDRQELQVSAAAKRTLKEHHWPGNVRELENVLASAAIRARTNVVEASDLRLGGLLPSPMRNEDASTADLSLAAAEAAHVQRVLDLAGGNKRRTARLLKISRQRLERCIERHDLAVPKRDQGGRDS